MRYNNIIAAAAALATAQANYIGFNYGNNNMDGSARQQSDFEAEFTRAKSLQGTNGEFTSARLYTTIQSGTTDTPISAIPAAIKTSTTLLITLWASAGQADFSNELTALSSAITQYGSAFTDLIAGICVGSEDLYRISPTGIENNSGVGAEPSTIVDYIKQLRSTLSGTAASGAKIGHVDTWTAWVNGSNDAVIEAVDWLGFDGYPYFQNTEANSIDDAKSLFYQSVDATQGAANGKPVWITETGWPVSGPNENQAVASVANAETYWQEVACDLLSSGVNVWWYILQDAGSSPSFGVVGSDLNSAPLYNLACNATNSTSSSSASSSATHSVTGTVSSATAPASATGSNSEMLSAATPGPEASTAGVSGVAASGTAAPYGANGTSPAGTAGASGTAGAGASATATTGGYSSPTLSATSSSATASTYTGSANQFAPASAGFLALLGLAALL